MKVKEKEKHREREKARKERKKGNIECVNEYIKYKVRKKVCVCERV